MPLELATRLILRDPADGSPVAVHTVRRVCAAWAEVQAAQEDTVDVIGRGGARVTTRTVGLDDGRTRWECEMRRTDDQDDHVEWLADVTGVFDPDRTTVAVRLRRDSSDQRLRPLLGAPKPPAVLREILSAEDIVAADGPLRVTAGVPEVARRDGAGFVTTCLLAPDRRLPVVAIGADQPDRYPRFDAARVARELAGFAHVRRIHWRALPEVAAELGELSVGQGSIRLWWPGLEVDTDPSIHPTWDLRSDDPRAAAEAIRSAVLEVSRDRWREPDRVRSFARDQRREADRRGQVVASRLADEVERLRESAERSSAASSAQDLAAVSRDVQALREEVDRHRSDAEYATELYEESDRQRESLQQRNLALQGQLDAALASLQHRDVGGAPRTPEDQLVAHVRESYERRLRTAEGAGPLPDFDVRDGFLSSIARSQANREKVVDAVAEVACGLAPNIPGREVHRMRMTPAGGSPPRVRAADGAVAWRCSIQNNSPSARRLHYWRRPDGTFEFVSVVVHDDFRIAD